MWNNEYSEPYKKPISRRKILITKIVVSLIFLCLVLVAVL